VGRHEVPVREVARGGRARGTREGVSARGATAGEAARPRAAAGAAAGAPFDLAGGPDAALFLHGLTGSPFEMRHVAERLCARGIRCLAPVMAGHGGGPEALRDLPWTAWVEQARRDLDRVAGARRTFVVGCSMGALVACALAHALPRRVDGLALLAPALRLSWAGQLGSLLARRTRLAAVVPYWSKRGGSDVRDAEMRRANPCMPAIPLLAVGELTELARHVDRILPRIAAPAIVIAGGRDHTVKLAGARRMARRIGSGPARLVVLPRSYHLVGVDVERDRCADEVATFLTGLPAPGAGASEKGEP
jgi:carboxylesterase